MFYQNYIALCNKIGKKPGTVAREIGFSNGATSVWKRGSVPQDANLVKIADYFQISVEELLSDDINEMKEKEKTPATKSDEGKDNSIMNREELKRLVDRLTDQEVSDYLSDFRKTILGQ